LRVVELFDLAEALGVDPVSLFGRMEFEGSEDFVEKQLAASGRWTDSNPENPARCK
jgi:hypothetical protein